MRARHLAAALLLAATALAGCKGDSGPAADGTLGVTPSSLVPDPSEPEGTTDLTEAGATTSTVAGAAPATTVAGSGPGAVPAPGSTPAPGADPRAAAQASLDAFLDALQSEDYPAAMRASGDGPRLLSFVRSLLKTLNSQAGATSTFSYAQRRYSPAAVTAERVVFSGAARLRQTTVTKSGERRSTEVEMGEAAVVQRGDRWLVAELVWEGSPIQFTSSSARAELTQGVTARLAGAVRFGATTAVVVGFETDKNLAVRVENDKLRGPGYNDASSFRALVNGYALFNYPRKSSAPARWTADIAVKPDPARPVSMSFA